MTKEVGYRTPFMDYLDRTGKTAEDERKNYSIVTGHLGFIGGALMKKLKSRDNHCVGYDVKEPVNTYTKLKGVDIIYHLGAIAGILDCEEDRGKAFTFNTSATQYWCEQALKKDARLVFTSSAAAGSTTPTWYGLTKKMSEDIIFHYKRHYSLKATIFRLPNIYGPGSLHKKSVIASMCKDAILEKKIHVHGNGTQIRNYVCVDDIVNLLMYFDKVGFFSIINGKVVAVNQLARHINKKFGVKIEQDKAREDFPVFKNLSDIIPKDISIGLDKTFDENLDATVEYFKEVLSTK